MYFSDKCPANMKNEVENWIAANGDNSKWIEQWLLEIKNDTVLEILTNKEEIWQRISLTISRSL